MKLCPKCQVEKPMSDFHACARYKDGKQVYCISCRRILVRNDKRERYAKDHRLREHLKEYQRRKRKTPEHRKRMREYFASYKKENPNFRIAGNLRVRMWQVLKKNKKVKKTIELLGCSVEDFKRHIESKWKNGMTWHNYGRTGWHIDHIIPCASFDLSSESEQRKCFHWSNMQPLWASENIAKSAKITSFGHTTY
jgi:hypothetical protein